MWNSWHPWLLQWHKLIQLGDQVHKRHRDCGNVSERESRISLVNGPWRNGPIRSSSISIQIYVLYVVPFHPTPKVFFAGLLVVDDKFLSCRWVWKWCSSRCFTTLCCVHIITTAGMNTPSIARTIAQYLVKREHDTQNKDSFTRSQSWSWFDGIGIVFPSLSQFMA